MAEEGTRARLAICEGCPFFSSDRRCYQCGCPMDVKATWGSAYCDDKRWGAVLGPAKLSV